MRAILLMIFGLYTFFPVFAQDDEISGMITDRPDQTESASIVPLGLLQIETGFIFQGDEAGMVTTNEVGLFTTLLRYGINTNFELRLGSAYLDVNDKPETGEEQTVSGLAPVFAGIKLKMLEENGAVPKMAFLVTVEIPGTGRKEFTPEHPATDLRFAMDYTFSNRIGLGMNLGGRWNGTDPAPAGVYSLVLGFGLLENLSMFVESYGFLPSDKMPDHRLDTGFTFALKNNLQLDASGGIGLSEVSPDYFVNAGISWRIPN